MPLGPPRLDPREATNDKSSVLLRLIPEFIGGLLGRGTAIAGECDTSILIEEHTILRKHLYMDMICLIGNLKGGGGAIRVD